MAPLPSPTPTAPTKSSPLADVSTVWTSASTSNDENLFAFSPVLPASKETTFSRRARSQSPITSLSTRTTAARDRRKSLFLEQIRTRREDEKFEGRGEQVLRMDWARGERERMGMLGRQAGRLDVDMEWEDDEMDGNGDADGPSPTEEKELEEMIRMHEEMTGREAGEEDMLDELEEEDYERLFRESGAGQEQESHAVMPQQQVQQESGFGWNQQDSAFTSGSAGVGGGAGEVMDMS
jgi:hypothetical protein